MSTTGMVMTVTDELLAEIEEAAKEASHWNLDACFQVVEEGYLPDEWYWHIGHYDEGNQYPVLLVDTDQYDAPPSDAKAVARHYANCGSRNIIAITAELRRLRAENAELAQSLAESRANDQAAMGWLTSLRWASGDRGERMLPDLITHIEELAKDSGRLDLLDSLCEAYGFQDIHEGNRWVIDGPFRDIRAAADSLEAQ